MLHMVTIPDPRFSTRPEVAEALETARHSLLYLTRYRTDCQIW